MCTLNNLGLQIPVDNQNNNLPTVKVKDNLLSVPLFTYYENKLKESKIPEIHEFALSKQMQNDYNNEMVRQTWKYQKKYGFETSTKPMHEFWNVEADAFKHAFGSADLYFKYGNSVSLAAGMKHEWQTNNNPPDEFNMDSWNNNQGREIAKEMIREYGNSLSTLSEEQRNDIIAEKIMQRMRAGQLITHPYDKRLYKGILENGIFALQNLLESVEIKKSE